MKKVLFTALVASILGANAFGDTITGTVESVTANAYGVIKVVIRKTDDTLSYPKIILGTADAQKTMSAVALTAKSSGATVDLLTSTYDGQTGCVSLVLK